MISIILNVVLYFIHTGNLLDSCDVFVFMNYIYNNIIFFSFCQFIVIYFEYMWSRKMNNPKQNNWNCQTYVDFIMFEYKTIFYKQGLMWSNIKSIRWRITKNAIVFIDSPDWPSEESSWSRTKHLLSIDGLLCIFQLRFPENWSLSFYLMFPTSSKEKVQFVFPLFKYFF